ncbi:MAG: efflux RND transporter periplasmic adaptor subunit [Spirochaetaceae bacterium]|nr:MAG: efflux RND transporter periplasmic adaptor subunit [Spirochaetaceae bacterium]
MKKRWWLVVIVIVIAALVLWLVFQRITASDNGASEAEPRVTVRTAFPRIGTIEGVLSTSGTLTASKTIFITSKLSGRVEAIPVQEGQAVIEGELLVQVEEETPRLQLEQAYGAWQAAQAQYEKALKGARAEELENARALYEKAEKDLITAEESFTRSKQLYDSGTIPKAQFEQAESALRAVRTELENAGRSLRMLEEGASPEEKRMARAQAEAAKASYELARLQLGFTRIRAPASAVVVEVLQDEGNIVGTSTPILVLIQDDRIQVEIEVAEKYYGEILGRDEALQARIYPQAYPGSTAFRGHILTVAPTIDPGSRTFTITLDIEDPQNLLRPGMYAEVDLILERVADALLVPASALLERDGQMIVFVVDKSEGTTVAASKTVIPGLAEAAEVQILSGVDPKDEVIVEGNTFLETGQRIDILENE